MPDSSDRLRELVAVLAGEIRLRAFAAVVLGARTTGEVAERAGISPREAAAALARLEASGLVLRSDGGVETVSGALAGAARAARAEIERDSEETGELAATPAQADVLARFTRGGRITVVPSRPAQRRVLLDFLAGQFAPGTRYPEREVNELLGRFHDDTATLRRLLVDEEFLDRDHGEYWRVGGTYEVD